MMRGTRRGKGSLKREYLNFFLDQWEFQGWKSCAKRYQQKEQGVQKHGGEKSHGNLVEWSHYVGL